MAVEDPRLTVLTLNVWGLWLVSKRRSERIRHLGKYLASSSEDVIFLQEVWVGKDADHLIGEAAKAGLRHGHHYLSGLFGSGLVIISRYPILQTDFWPYVAAGNAIAINHGDFFAGKGIAWARIDSPIGSVDVFNTHLHANYRHTFFTVPPKVSVDLAGTQVPNDDTAACRIAQIVQLAQTVQQASSGGSGAVVLAGDLNGKPHSLEMQLLLALLPQLHDCWLAANTSAAEEEGFTCDAPGNSFHSYKQVPERIDYILSSLPVVRSDVALKRTPAGVSYSDHFAVRAVLVPLGSAVGTLPPPRPPRGPAVWDISARVLRRGEAQGGLDGKNRIMGALAAPPFLAISYGMYVLGPPQTNDDGVMTYRLDWRMLSAVLLALALTGGGAWLLLAGLLGDLPLRRALRQAEKRLEMARARVWAAGSGTAGGDGSGDIGEGEGNRVAAEDEEEEVEEQGDQGTASKED